MFLYMAHTWGVPFTLEEITTFKEWTNLEPPTVEEKETKKSIYTAQEKGNPSFELLNKTYELFL